VPLRPAPSRARPLRAAGLVLAVALPSSVHAQWIGVAGEDALVLRGGRFRVTVQGRIEGFDERYTSDATGATASERVPLGAAFSSPSLGVELLPALAPVQTRLRSLTNTPGFELSLGDVRVDADARRSTVPVRFDLGIGGRLQLSAMVPYVETRVAARVTANPNATGGNVGLNPALAEAAAASANQAVVTQLRSAATQLRSQLAACTTTPSAPACTQRATAEQLSTAVETFATDLATVYGVPSATGSGVVPVQGSAASVAVAARIAAFGTQFRTFGVDVVAPGTAPRGATAPLTGPQFAAALGDGTLGIGLAPLGEARRYGIGDVEVGARFRVADPYGGDPGRARPAGAYVRATIGALFRMGTGEPDDPTNVLDLGVGDGQNDVEVMAAADIVTGPRFATALVARYGVQMPDELDRLVPAAAGEAYTSASNVQRVRRDLGDYTELEIAPRYTLTRVLALGAHYRFRSKAADTYETVPDPLVDPSLVVLDPAILGVGSETREQVAGLSLVMSTLPAFAGGGARLPVEVSYRHLRTISGGGRLTPHGTYDEVTLRVFLDLFRRR